MAVCWAAWPVSASAAVSLPAFFSDGMVLQRNTPCPIWGWAKRGEQAVVQLGNLRYEAVADETGRWSVTLPPMPAARSQRLLVTGPTNSIAINDVAIGEVWVASGQSNMVWSVARSNGGAEAVAASGNPDIRFFKVANAASVIPLPDVTGKWLAASSANTGNFSAAAYFMARELHQSLQVPIGIVQTAWGGSPAEAWVSATSLTADPSLLPVLQTWARHLEAYPRMKAAHAVAVEEVAAGQREKAPTAPVEPNAHNTPSALYNGMIAPLVPYAMRGVIWYQGEKNANRGDSEVYEALFSTLISSWRQAWGQGSFPFIYVQLPNFAKVSEGAEWPELREAQRATLALSNTAMVVSIDVGQPDDIHPTNKMDIGHRLALAAQYLAYGKNLVPSGPLFRQATREGKAMRIYFDHVGKGLRGPDPQHPAAKGQALSGFEIAGRDGRFQPAQARIDGDTVVVEAGDVPAPLRVRYLWANNPVASLFNADGLPASPFRSR